MKRLFCHPLAATAAIWSAISALCGCGGPDPHAPKIEWNGVDSGYHDASTAQPQQPSSPPAAK